MRPGELLLELVSLVALLSCLLGLLKASLGLLVGFLEVRDDLGLACQDLSGLTDVLHARLILLAELAQLCSFQEELVIEGERSRYLWCPTEATYFVLVGRGRCREELSGGVWGLASKSVAS